MKNANAHHADTVCTNTPDPDKNKNRPWWKNPPVMIVLGLLYCISPIDLIPDIPVVGWIDDIGVLGYVIKTVLEQRKKDSESAV